MSTSSCRTATESSAFAVTTMVASAAADAGTLSPMEFLSPDNLGRLLGAASAPA